MVRALFGVLVLLLAFACRSAEHDVVAAAESVDIVAVSFNIRYANPGDGDNRWDLRKELVVETLRAHDADLFGLQEALPRQTRFVANAMVGYEHYALGRRGEGVVDEACPVFWRSARFECLEKKTVWLAPDPARIAKAWDAALPRVCSFLRLRDRRTGLRFVFANAHFDHRGKRARNESAAMLARMWPGERVLLVGDFNAGEDSLPLKRFSDAGFVDTFRAVHPSADIVGTYSGFRVRGRKKIDYVLVRGDSMISTAKIDDSHPGGRWPSDHLPVAATIRWLDS